MLTPVAQPTPVSTVAPIPKVPHAELVKLPPWQIDEERLLVMPYSEIVQATLRGYVDSYNHLPRRGQLGDTWLIAGTPGVWVHPPGSSILTWVDR
jgi:hypothetical protein